MLSHLIASYISSDSLGSTYWYDGTKLLLYKSLRYISWLVAIIRSEHGSSESELAAGRVEGRRRLAAAAGPARVGSVGVGQAPPLIELDFEDTIEPQGADTDRRLGAIRIRW